ncbi:hypothetical protein F66182_3684 [Fusarium sp. NRRL 66182]|nr:hypothetical protein F66182_3684 [Fusarium sp. NRRL 66182]
MTHQRADALVDELALDWGQDTIYCEATCDPKDIFYEGSDDEDYDNPASRKIRIEAAGQRYLEGKTPFLLTALLKGPFDGDSTSWVNPWRSKYRTAGALTGVRISPGKLARSARIRSNVSIPETVQPPNESLECHLPSPESLSQASKTESHPYLEEDELVKVHEWRSTVESAHGAKDQFWASTPHGSASERKRKAKGSSWLKLLASKRRRTDVMESGSVDTPVPRRAQPPNSAGDGFNISFESAPDRLPSSAIAAERYFSTSHNEISVSEDELSRDKIATDQAAADLSSSPLSYLQYTPVPDPSVNSSSQGSLQQQTPSKGPLPRRHSMPDEHFARSQNLTDHNASKPGAAFETQEDQSFCFKMRSKPTTAGSAPNEEQSVANDNEDTWSGLSSPDQDVQSLMSDIKDSTPMEERLDGQNLESATTEDQCGMTSPLSSISSENYDGFDLSEESSRDIMDIDDASSVTDSAVTSTNTDAGSPQSSTKAEIMAITPQSPSKPRQEDGFEEEEPHGTIDAACQLEAEDLSAHDTGSKEGPDNEEDDKFEFPKIVSASTTCSKEASHLTLERQEAETTPSKPAPSGASSCVSTPSHAEFLLKASVKKKFIPRSSWDKLSHLTRSPVRQNQPDKRATQSPTEASSPISTRGIKICARPSSSTLQAMVCSRPSTSNASPTKIDATVQGSLQEQIKDQTLPKQDVSIPFSQQSPWAGSKLSEYASLSLSQLPAETPKPEMNEGHSIATTASPAAQTPWVKDTTELPTEPFERTPIVDQEVQAASHAPNTSVAASEADTPMQDVSVTATPLTGATPEPRFSVKSFASFRSASPDRCSHKVKRTVWRDSGSRLPCTQGILASATKNPWETKSSQRRVSFAPLPHETEGHSSLPTTPCPSLGRGRQTSPPPDTPAAELPTSEDAKFHKHFDAVARGPIVHHRERLLPSESQRTVGSPMPDAMAETFLTADQLRQQAQLAGPAKSDRETEESQDPLDMVEDVFREMGDFFEKWDVDNVVQTPQTTQGPQSPW